MCSLSLVLLFDPHNIQCLCVCFIVCLSLSLSLSLSFSRSASLRLRRSPLLFRLSTLSSEAAVLLIVITALVKVVIVIVTATTRGLGPLSPPHSLLSPLLLPLRSRRGQRLQLQRRHCQPRRGTKTTNWTRLSATIDGRELDCFVHIVWCKESHRVTAKSSLISVTC